MKMKQFLVGACALTLLASCGKNVEEIMKDFKAEVTGTVSLTFNSKYKVDVISEKGGMDNFKHDVDDKVVAEVDLTKDNLYLYVKNDAKDGEVSSTKEALLFKEGTSYKYVTSEMAEPVEVASETDARAKIDELLNKVSSNLAGYVDTSSLVFAKDGAYEHKQFGLGTENIAQEDFISTPTIESQKKGKGIKVTGGLDYIGYHTDAGISDFPGKEGAPASTYEINTNELGYVTSYAQQMDASLAMPIMTPAPIVTIQGSKTLEATYGETITKKTEISHSLTTSRLNITSMTGGHVECYMAPTKDGEKKQVSTGSELVVGQYLAIKVHPAGANTILMVTFAGKSLDTPDADGYFYFEIPAGKADLAVNFTGSDVDESTKFALIDVIVPEGFTYTVQWFVFANNAPGERQELIEGKLPVGKSNFASLKFKAPEGFEEPAGKSMVPFIGDQKLSAFPGGEYAFNVKEERAYTVEYKLVDDLPELKTADPSVFGKLVIKTCPEFDTAHMTDVTMDTVLKAGDWLCIQPKEGNTIATLTLNGKQCMLEDPSKTGGWYCFTLVGGDNTLVATFTE